MRILITGDRNWQCVPTARLILFRLQAKFPTFTIISGHCRGVDVSLETSCKEMGIPNEIYPADWSKGKRSGPMRNQKMVDSGIDMTIGFHQNIGLSRGTRDCLTRSLDKGIPTFLVIDDVGKTVRLKQTESGFSFV